MIAGYHVLRVWFVAPGLRFIDRARLSVLMELDLLLLSVLTERLSERMSCEAFELRCWFLAEDL